MLCVLGMYSIRQFVTKVILGMKFGDPLSCEGSLKVVWCCEGLFGSLHYIFFFTQSLFASIALKSKEFWWILYYVMVQSLITLLRTSQSLLTKFSTTSYIQHLQQTSIFSHKTSRLCQQATITRGMHAKMLIFLTPKPVVIHYLWLPIVKFESVALYL